MNTDFDTIMAHQAREEREADLWQHAQLPAPAGDAIRGIPVEPIVHLGSTACPLQAGVLGGGSFTASGDLDIPF